MASTQECSNAYTPPHCSLKAPFGLGKSPPDSTFFLPGSEKLVSFSHFASWISGFPPDWLGIPATHAPEKGPSTTTSPALGPPKKLWRKVSFLILTSESNGLFRSHSLEQMLFFKRPSRALGRHWITEILNPLLREAMSFLRCLLVLSRHLHLAIPPQPNSLNHDVPNSECRPSRKDFCF